MLFLNGFRASAAETDAIPGLFERRALAAHVESRAALLAQNKNPTNAWVHARSCFDLAEFSRTSADRERLAKEGIAAAKDCIAINPKLAAGHYYLALNMGQLARTRTLGALPLVSEMEKVLQRAAALDKNFDYGGPDRSLGLLYLDAPGWPTSVGNKKKAREQLERVVVLHPSFPENQICLFESLVRLKDQKRAAELLPNAKKIIEEAEKKFTGERWEQSWADWRKRWGVILAALE